MRVPVTSTDYATSDIQALGGRLPLREQIAQQVMPGCAAASDVHREDASRDALFLREELHGEDVDQPGTAEKELAVEVL
jgi:hypothetical protein